jgi:hypothetical protein
VITIGKKSNTKISIGDISMTTLECVWADGSRSDTVSFPSKYAFSYFRDFFPIFLVICDER